MYCEYGKEVVELRFCRIFTFNGIKYDLTERGFKVYNEPETGIPYYAAQSCYGGGIVARPCPVEDEDAPRYIEVAYWTC
jgi:hypothetical protein